MSDKHQMPLFYICPICGNLVEMVHSSGRIMVCCGQEMKQLIPGSTDGKTEFHIPVCKIKDQTVSVDVGANPHPMLEEHHISWIELVTDRGIHRIDLCEKADPHVCFHIGKKEQVLAVYAYCNLHGLWAVFCSE